MGRMIDVNGQPVKNRLFDQLAAGSIDDPRIVAELQNVMPVGMEFVECPLKDAIWYLQDQHNIPFVIDARRVRDIDRPLTLNLKGIDLCSGLAVLTAPHRLVIEYRYGVLFVTTEESVEDWQDPTGVAAIRPPPGSPLAQAWEEPCAIDAIEVPMNQVLQSLGQPLAIGFDLTGDRETGIPVSFPVTKSLKNLPFKHVLALLLDDVGFRCEVRGNDTLVILLQHD